MGVETALPGGVLVGLFRSTPFRMEASRLSTDFVLLRNRLKNVPPRSLFLDGDGGARNTDLSPLLVNGADAGFRCE